MNNTTSVIREYHINPVHLPLGEMEINGIRLRKFQEDLFLSLEKHNKLCLQAPTGSGKTFSIFALFLHAMDLRRPVVGIYPSRELVKDQAKSVINTMKRMGLNLKEEKENAYAVFEGKITAKLRDKTIKEEEGEIYVVILTSESKDEVYEILSNYTPTKYLIMLTVPEYPYMYISHLGKMPSMSTVIEAVIKGVEVNVPKDVIRDLFTQFAKFFNGYYFVDEYHLYTGLSRSSLSLLVRMIDDYNANNLPPKYVFSSATPVNIPCEETITATPSNEGDVIRKETRLVLHFTTTNPQEEIVKEIENMVKSDKKTAIIVDRVYYISQICEKIEASVVWGLDKTYGKCRKSEDIRKERLLVGNHAISFGVDIPDLDYGIIHAHDAETAIQRIGRFGRHGSGLAEIHVYIKAGDLDKVMKERELDLEKYLSLIHALYKKRLDDGLDAIEFAKVREEIMFKSYETLKKIANSENVTLEKMNVNLPQLIQAEDYFKLFAFRPGGIEGRWCSGGTDDFFTMLRNFEYDYERHCFKDTPLKQNPEVILVSGTLKKYLGKIVKASVFFKDTQARIVMNRERKIKMSEIKELSDTFVIPLNSNSWSKFSPEIARLVSTYASALVACEGENKFPCDRTDALLLFI